ncbi:4'-phosphopantetheinyl transferase superfamily protein [Bacillus sp. YC2]|uniref:4'-phosphopantetheinyl transferase family protein n=1 Tax=Bacillus sp. YC2 TaxID=2861287 RepID=UPI001CA6D456|nr:4'-phosphopantetheinyl transferase superfamily protein [Bacillus sp. YC2]MBY8913494.1 4'-phosphopantetheinyl transferase superfamily protein [Bacillus sp. YC2]
MKIYGVYMDRPLSAEESERMMSVVSAEKREKCRRFYHEEDAHRTLIGDVLVRTVIGHENGLDPAAVTFSVQEYGKPYIPSLPAVHFNISHSGRWIVCAVDSAPIGIDIEKLKPGTIDIAKRFFSQTEYNDLQAKHPDEQTDYFYHLWSMKESFIKQAGKGLSLPLDSFSVRLQEDGQVSIELPDGHEPCFIRTYDVDAGYKMAVCAAQPDFCEGIEMKTYEELL